MDTKDVHELGPNLDEDLKDLLPQPALQRQFTALACTSGELHPTVPPRPVSVLMIGTGEYTTGYVAGKASDSDKGAGGKLCLLHRSEDSQLHCLFLRSGGPDHV